jgi:hypothetical protein
MGWLEALFGKKQSKHELDYDRIIRAYGAVLEASSAEMISDENSLPVPKSDLAPILLAAIQSTRDAELKEFLEFSYVSLAKFVKLTDDQWKEVDVFERISADPLAMQSDQLVDLIADSGKTFSDTLNAIQKEMALLQSNLQRSGR